MDVRIDNNGVEIHYIVTGNAHNDGRLPLVVIPGMINTADEFAAEMADRINRRCVFMSLRGRGKSAAPQRGYRYQDQLSDAQAVIDHAGIERLWVMGHSVGVAFAVGYALREPGRVAGLILSDFPPYYPKFTEAWADRVAMMPDNTMPDHALRGIVDEGERILLGTELSRITCPTLVTRGGAQGSLLPEESAILYADRLLDCRVEVLDGVGHEPFDNGGAALFRVLQDFLEAHDPAHSPTLILP